MASNDTETLIADLLRQVQRLREALAAALVSTAEIQRELRNLQDDGR